jgi:tetratricopeptide (TPR) repeat protein
VLLLVAAAAQRRPDLGAAALALLVLVLVSGAAGGSAYHDTARFRERGWIGRAASWSLTAGVPIGILIGAMHGLMPRLSLGDLETARITRLTGTTAGLIAALAVLLFGMIMAEVETSDTHVRVFVWLNDDLSRGTALTWATIVLIGWSAFKLFGDLPSLELPDTRPAARHVFAAAQAEARARPNDAHSQLAYGLALMRLDRYDEAFLPLERAARLDPNDTYSRNVLGWMHNQKREYADAVPYLEEAVRLDPEYTEAFHNLAWALAHLDRLAEAEDTYRETVHLDPHDASAAYEYALTLYRRNKEANAIAAMRRAIKLDSTNAEFHSTMGYFLRGQAHFAAAKTEFERAVELNPDVALTWAQLGVTNYLLGDAHGADAAFAAAARRDSTAVRRGSAEYAMWEEARRGKTGISGARVTTVIH